MIDKQFKKRIAKGETEAIVELYDQHGESLLKYLAAKVGTTNSRDVLQNVFTRLFRYHRQLAKAKNTTAYIFRTASNEAIRFQQNSANRKSVATQSLDDSDEPTAPATSSTSSIENQETAQQLLEHLDEASREIVQLKIFSGLTFKQVAKIVGLPEQTAATKYRRAIQQLRQLSNDPPAISSNVNGSQSKIKLNGT